VSWIFSVWRGNEVGMSQHLCDSVPVKSSKSAFALVGGILTILGSFGCILLSLFFVNGFIYNWGEYPNVLPIIGLYLSECSVYLVLFSR
jgi:hypothetical protein